jgi:hypothetical protein
VSSLAQTAYQTPHSTCVSVGTRTYILTSAHTLLASTMKMEVAGIPEISATLITFKWCKDSRTEPTPPVNMFIKVNAVCSTKIEEIS